MKKEQTILVNLKSNKEKFQFQKRPKVNFLVWMVLFNPKLNIYPAFFMKDVFIFRSYLTVLDDTKVFGFADDVLIIGLRTMWPDIFFRLLKGL